MTDKLDILLQRMEDHIAQSAEHRDETKKWRDSVEQRLDKTEEQLFLYKTVIKIGKWLGGLLLLIITLKLGDIGKYFHNG